MHFQFHLCVLCFRRSIRQYDAHLRRGTFSVSVLHRSWMITLFRLFSVLLSIIYINPQNAELNPICHLLALLGAHHILRFSRIRVNTASIPSPTRNLMTVGRGDKELENIQI